MRAPALFATSFFGLTLAALAASCSTQASYVDCDAVVTRCRTVCQTYCDGWGCYPVCYDQCWDECHQYPSPPPEPEPGPPGPPVDGGASGPSTAVLCKSCTSNDDCGGGGLCIQRTGASDAGAASFCGSPCTSNADCPEGFACTPLGASRQCIPTSGHCE